MSISSTLREVLTRKSASARRLYQQSLTREDDPKAADAHKLAEALDALKLTPGDFDSDRSAITRAAELRAKLPDAGWITATREEFDQRKTDRLQEAKDCRARRRAVMAEFRQMLQREADIAVECESDRSQLDSAIASVQSLQGQLSAIVAAHPRAFEQAVELEESVA